MKKILEDIENVESAKIGNSEAINFLLNKYDPIIESYSLKFFYLYPVLPLEVSDIKQHLRVAFWKLIHNYKLDSPKSFPAYIKQFLIWRGHQELKKYLASKTRQDNYYIHLLDDSNIKFNDTTPTDVGILKECLEDVEFLLIDYLFQGYRMIEVSQITKYNIGYLYKIRKSAFTKLRENSEIFAFL